MAIGSRKDALFKSTNILSKTKATRKSYQESRPLQAYRYTGLFSFLFSNALKCLKRASFRLPVACSASVSIEASIAIPVFLFCFLEILSLINYLSVYSGVLYAMKSAAEPIAIYSYVYDKGRNKNEPISIGEETVSSLVFSEAYLDTQIHQRCNGNLYQSTVKDGVKGIRLLGSHIDWEKSCVDVIAYYTVKPTVSFAGTEQFMINRYYTKLWTGYRREENIASANYVYITENGNVYHLQEDCTHLKLSISGVNAEIINDMRNEWGGKYSECFLCCDNSVVNGTYYITEQGDRYHESIGCAGLKRTIYCVEKEEVSDWSVCSRCNQRAGAEK